jgi:hypothetical protein
LYAPEGAYAPQQVHISLGKDATQMVVVWYAFASSTLIAFGVI